MNRKKQLFQLMAIVALVVAILACGTDNIGEKIEESDDSVKTLPTMEIFGVGEVIQVKEHTIVLNSVEFHRNIVIANFTIENGGTDDLNISSLLSFSAKNSEGTKLEEEIFDCGTSGLDGKLLSGDKLRGDICWKGAVTESVRIYYEASLFGSGAVVWEVKNSETSVEASSPEPTKTLESDSTQEPTIVVDPTKTPEPTVTLEPTVIPVLGDVVEGHGYFLSAVTLEDPAENPGSFYDPEEGKKLVAVEYIIGNVSGEQISFNVLYTTLIDSEGFVYEPELGGVENQIGLLDLNPGEKIKGWAGFVIPEDSIPVILKYAFSGSSTNVLQTGLEKSEGEDKTIHLPAYTINPNTPMLGDVIENFGYSLSAVTLEDPAENPGSFYDPEEGKKLVAVEYIIGNVSGEQISFNVLYTTLIDSEGFVYEPDLGGVENQIGLQDLNPGEKIKGWAGFVIPEDSIPVVLKYTFSSSSNKFLEVRLTSE